MIRKSSDSKAVEAAAAAVREARGRLLEWETTKAGAETELARLHSVAGEEVLDDPAAAERLPKLMQEQRDRIDVDPLPIAGHLDVVQDVDGAISAKAEVVSSTVNLDGSAGRWVMEVMD